jgi:hypothetical protein
VVLIVSDHPQLAPFGPVIEYNGRDAFELGACGTVTLLSSLILSFSLSLSSGSSLGAFVLPPCALVSVGCSNTVRAKVVAPLDGRDPHSPLAQFFFQRYEAFGPSEQAAAIANTQQLYDQLLERAQVGDAVGLGIS